jgi:formylglycine-generating enzyme required for sulfatase activity
MIQTAVLIASLALQSTPAQQPTFEEKLPKALATFKMVKVPDGSITLDGKTYPVKDLYFGQTEVTWDLYEPYFLSKDLTEQEQAVRADAKNRPSRPYGTYLRGFGHLGHPAIGMHLNGAQKFCEWLSKVTGKKYRLPTEAEWQYAALAGKPPIVDLNKVAWYYENSDDTTHPVGKLEPNSWGLFDMLGNAAEWTTSLKEDMVTRGGSWRDKADLVNFTARIPYSPDWQEGDAQMPKSKWWLSDNAFVGFRVVCEAK